VPSSHREGSKRCRWSLAELVEGTAELGTTRSSLAMAMCLARVGGRGGECLSGHRTGLFIGAKAWAGAKQQPDHNLQQNQDLVKGLASNRIGFCFCLLQ
jgi:hypothetical protein